MTKVLLSLALSATLSTACSSDDPAMSADGAPVDSTAFVNYEDIVLPDLGPDSVYEGWLIVDGTPISTGRFTVDADGNPSDQSFMVDAADADSAVVFVLTIEPAVGDDPSPADTHILAGAIASGSATLATNHPAALNTDFANAAGGYILATPTTGDATLQEQGIWWLTPGDTPSVGLTLPSLPAGWAYEGWIVGANGPVSTGRFVDPAATDSDGAGSTKGPTGDGPPFPGQDFITPATVLNDGTTVAVISVEPDPDTSDAPFLIKPLIHDPIGTEVAPVQHQMTNNAAATLPSVTVTIVSE